MLRYVAKHTIIRDWKDGDKVVCTYHIKTLMLWACERKSPVWWESKLRHCSLFETSWNIDEVDRRQKMCPHYFIPEWNLFDYTMNDSRRFETIEMLNIHTSIHALSELFRINYLSKVFYDNKYIFIITELLEISTRAGCRCCIISVPSRNFKQLYKMWIVETHFEQSYLYDSVYCYKF